MKNTLAMVAAGIVLAGLPQVSAVPITGQLSMGGNVQLNNTSLGAATAVTSFSGVFADVASDGDFEDAGWYDSDSDGIPDGAPVTVKGFDFTSFSPVSELWTLVWDGDTFEFDLTGLTVQKHTATFLDILGSGTLTRNDADATPGTFSFTISDADGQGANGTFTFAFQANTSPGEPPVAAPDGGFTAGLFGLGILSLMALKRRASR